MIFALAIAKVEEDDFPSVSGDIARTAPLNKTEAFLHHARSNFVVEGGKRMRSGLTLLPFIRSFKVQCLPGKQGRRKRGRRRRCTRTHNAFLPWHPSCEVVSNAPRLALSLVSKRNQGLGTYQPKVGIRER